MTHTYIIVSGHYLSQQLAISPSLTKYSNMHLYLQNLLTSPFAIKKQHQVILWLWSILSDDGNFSKCIYKKYMYVMCLKCWGFFSLVIRQTVCVDSSLSKVKVKTVDWNRGTPHSQSMSDVAYINKSYISTSTFCRFPGLPTILLLRVEVPGTSAYGHFERNTASLL